MTTTTLPRDRYSPNVVIETPITMRGTGFSREGLDLGAYRSVKAMLNVQGRMGKAQNPDEKEHSTFNIQHSTFNIVHFTGVHAWNLPLVRGLRRQGIPVVHTLHDLDPHMGVRFGTLIRLWNRLLIASGCHLLVPGQGTREQLIARGVPAEQVTYAPLLHGFLGAERAWPPERNGEKGSGGEEERGRETGRNAGRKVNVLFFGRIEAYKGVEDLLAAWAQMTAASFDSIPHTAAESRSGCSQPMADGARLIIAGPVAQGVTQAGSLRYSAGNGVELRDRRIDDAEANALFRDASLLVLPYRDATQSALIAAAYAYGLPVIVTRAGALAEYVVEGETGWIVPPADPAALAAALRQALTDPARLTRMGEAGRAWFTARRQEEETILTAMYRYLLS